MTPPPKKTSRAKTGAKQAPARKPAPKKRRTRKKKSGGSIAPILLAFAVGIALTVSLVWIYNKRDLLDPRNLLSSSTFGQKQSSPSGNVAGKDRSAREVSGKSPSPAKSPVASAKGGRVPSGQNGQDRPSGTGGKAPDNAAGETPRPDPTTNSAVASALIDLKSLPYEESLSASLDERIRQVDYALMQAAWLKKIPASSLRLVSVEDRLEGVEPYQYQIIDVLPGKNTREYLKSLSSCLSAWAEGAVLNDQGDNQWLIVINGVRTHLIRLFPGRRDFPPLPGGTAPPADHDSPGSAVPSSPPTGTAPPRAGFDRHKTRAPGEAAKLVIVIDDLGASHAATQQLLALSYPVTFAFWPHGNHTRQGALAAHRAGREILIHQPMEPLGYPKVRPGPNVLLVGMSLEKIQSILEASIAAVPHAVGLNNHMGSRFTQSGPGVDAVIDVLKRHGLFMLDSLTHSSSVFAYEGRRLGIEHYQRNVFLDVTASRSSIMKELRRAEKIALLTGRCIAIGHPLPETLAALKEWQRTRNKDVHIVRLRDL